MEKPNVTTTQRKLGGHSVGITRLLEGMKWAAQKSTNLSIVAHVKHMNHQQLSLNATWMPTSYTSLQTQRTGKS